MSILDCEKRMRKMQLKRAKTGKQRSLRRQKLGILLANNYTPSSSPEPPSLLSLEKMVTVCRENWSTWLAQVTAVRMQQVSTLSRSPSVEQIELLLDLEKLGNQLEQVKYKDEYPIGSIIRHYFKLGTHFMNGRIMSVDDLHDFLQNAEVSPFFSYFPCHINLL